MKARKVLSHLDKNRDIKMSRAFHAEREKVYHTQCDRMAVSPPPKLRL
jgi:hypothetical protein